MPITIKRLAVGDEAILDLLAKEDADFDLDERGGPLLPLSRAAAARYLANPSALSWVALDESTVVGHLQCVVIPLRAGEGIEVLLYEIGVRSAFRRRGIGRLLLDEMEAWMRANDALTVWVLADNPEAVLFYRASGMSEEDPQPVYMLRELVPNKS